MTASQSRSGTIPLLHHPLVLPTLVVVGGWVLLLGGSFPGQGPPPSSGVHPGGSPAIDDTFPAPEAQEPAPSAVVTVLDGGSSSAPIRLTIEFPNGSAAPAVITLPGREPRLSDASESRSASLDSQIIRTGTPLIEEPVVPPPIPGPPPDFDPTILSPLIPESVPVSPIFDRDTSSAEPLIARPMEELPDTFNPGLLLERYRSHEPWRSEPPATDSGATPVARTGGPLTINPGDQAPEPPVIPESLPEFSNAPVILPEPSSETRESWTSSPRSTPASALEATGPAVPIRQPPTPQRRGLRGLFRAFRPPPPIPLVPPPPMAQGASSDTLRK